MKPSTLLCLSLINITSLFAHTPPDSIVWEPRVVAIPPSDAYIGLLLLETGEIRHYNYGEQAESGSFYLLSTDNGYT